MRAQIRIPHLSLVQKNTSRTQIPRSPTTNPKQDSALLAGGAAPAPARSPRAWSSLCRQAAPRPRPSSSEPSALPPTESRKPSASPPADALEEPAVSGEEKAGAPGKEPAGRIRGREGRSSSGRAPPPQAQRLLPRLQRPLWICAQVQTTPEEPLPQGHASPRRRRGCEPLAGDPHRLAEGADPLAATSPGSAFAGAPGRLPLLPPMAAGRIQAPRRQPRLHRPPSALPLCSVGRSSLSLCSVLRRRERRRFFAFPLGSYTKWVPCLRSPLDRDSVTQNTVH